MSEHGTKKRDCNNVVHAADKKHSSCKDFGFDPFTGFGSSSEGSCRGKAASFSGHRASSAFWLQPGVMLLLAQAMQQRCRGLHKLYAAAKHFESTYPREGQPLCQNLGDRAGAAEQVVPPQPPETSAARHTHQGLGCPDPSDFPWDVFPTFLRHRPTFEKHTGKKKLRQGAKQPHDAAQRQRDCSVLTLWAVW